MRRVPDTALGQMVRKLRVAHGVTFHLGSTVKATTGQLVILHDDTARPADLVALGIGVAPTVAIVERAGISTDRGNLVDEVLETSVQGIFAGGDVAQWPDPRCGARIRVEHWAVAERQGLAVNRANVTIQIPGTREGWPSMMRAQPAPTAEPPAVASE